MSATATLQEMTNEKLKWNHTHSQLTCKNTPTHFKKEKKNVKGRHKQSHYIYIYILHHCTKGGRVEGEMAEGWWRDSTITSLTTAWMHQTGNYKEQTDWTTHCPKYTENKKIIFTFLQQIKSKFVMFLQMKPMERSWYWLSQKAPGLEFV